MAETLYDQSLLSWNTFGVDVKAAVFSQPSNQEDLALLATEMEQLAPHYLILGEGSNLLFTSNFDGIVVQPKFKGVEVIYETKTHVEVKVGSAENWDLWVQYALSMGWYGFENLSLIPGSVGAAPVQNIGAYGVELNAHVKWVEVWDMQLKNLIQLSAEACQFAYRSSMFKSDPKRKYIITSVCFRLPKKAALNLEYGPVKDAFEQSGGQSALDLRKVIIDIRRNKLPDPAEYGNAGSFFKNPVVDRTIFKCLRVDYPQIPNYREKNNQVKIPAAWLIEQAGLKGTRVGNVGTWPTQPLVIVNYGGATGSEILEFSEMIRDTVNRKFGIYLEREVRTL